MSADTTPISPARFALAIKDLTLPTLHIKYLEITNSVAHLEYSNDQLKPFAEGRAPILRSRNNSVSQQEAVIAAAAVDGPAGEPDEDCVQAIEENERVIERMVERLGLIKLEIEERGVNFEEFMGAARVRARVQGEEAQRPAQEGQTNEADSARSSAVPASSSPWTDGSITTGTIRNGQVHINNEAGGPTREERDTTTAGGGTGGSLSDEQLRAALERQVGNLDPGADGEGNEDDDRGEGGLYI